MKLFGPRYSGLPSASMFSGLQSTTSHFVLLFIIVTQETFYDSIFGATTDLGHWRFLLDDDNINQMKTKQIFNKYTISTLTKHVQNNHRSEKISATQQTETLFTTSSQAIAPTPTQFLLRLDPSKRDRKHYVDIDLNYGRKK